MERPCMLREEEQEPEVRKREGETKQVGDDDDELILVGVEDVNEDADVIFVGMTSASKPVVSNILNRDTQVLVQGEKGMVISGKVTLTDYSLLVM